MEITPQIALLYEEEPAPLKELADFFVSTVNFDGLDIRSESRPAMGPMMCVEWYLPTALILFFGKSYFDSFFKEMGKDHYQIFKKGTSAIWEKLFSKDKVIKYELVGTPGKITKNY